MSDHNLKHLYIRQVHYAQSACDQSEDIVRRMTDIATEQELVDALCDGVLGIERGRDTMEHILANHSATTQNTTSQAMAGLVADAEDELFVSGYDDRIAQDAAIIAHFQKMAHYAIACYSTIGALAERLDLEKEQAAVRKCLDATHEGEQRFTEIGTHWINIDAK